MHQVWQEILSLPPGETALYDALRQLGSDFDRLEQQIADSKALSEDTKADYRSVLANLRSCLSPHNLRVAIRDLHTLFDSNQLRPLLGMGDLLGNEFPEPSLTESDIEEIRQALKELDDLLLECDLPSTLRSFLVAQVASMRSALENVNLYGVDALHDALARTIFAFNRVQPANDDPSKSKALKARARLIFKSIMGVLEKADKLVGYGRNALGLAADLGLLPPSGG